ncbi:flagellar biosynthetic protein FliO [Acidithiobacillus thiooxidans]|uniref:flagellar biosynthetic protein FliO n=1 Tax=Acidithiobacillus thiooxidans TaxID=930 RepID=UPI003561CF57
MKRLFEAPKFWLIFWVLSGFSPLAQASTPAVMDTGSPFSWMSILQLFAALLFVLAVFFVVIWMLKHFQPGAMNNPVAGLKVVTSLPLGTRERLLLVQVGEQQLLLGVTPTGIHLLHTLETSLPDTTSNSATAFASWLRTAMERRKQGTWSPNTPAPKGNIKTGDQHPPSGDSSPD